MAAGSVRFRSTYYNTTGDPIEWQIDILDTEPVAQIINFESTEPVISFEGLTQDLKPGIYPSTLKFGFYVRDTIFTKGGVNYGPSASIINDLLTSNEGRFRVKVYRDGALYYCGIILPDQCQYEDDASPYLLSITVADGMYRWKDRSYLSLFGYLNYATCEEYDQQPGSPNSTPLDTCLEGTEWTLIEHYSTVFGDGQEPEGVQRTSTYARRQQYATESPGAGWVDQGDGLWAKAVDYTNEVIINETDVYHLTRDLENTTHRRVTDILQAAIEVIDLGDEYGAEMWDTASEWYEQNMDDLTADPLYQTRLHEGELFEGDVQKAVEEICKLFFLRAYYSNGRYHFEQISYRDVSTFKRFPYLADGTAGTAETVNLDVNMATEGIRVAAGGSYRILSPLKSAEVKISFDGDNILEGEGWYNWNGEVRTGQRYLGRIARGDGVQKLRLVLRLNLSSYFNKSTLGALSGDEQWMSAVHKHNLAVTLRLRDTELGTTYFLTGDADVTETSQDDNCTLDTPDAYTFLKKWTFGDQDSGIFTVNNNKQGRYYVLTFTSDDMPVTVDNATYDVHLNINGYHNFVYAIGQEYWGITNPTQYKAEWGVHSSSLVFVDEDGNETGTSTEKVYFVENNSGNSLKVENSVIWADTGRAKQSIEIETSAGWRKSLDWSIAGVGTGQPLLALCASEIMSLRLSPKKLYSGQFISGHIDPQDRILRATSYYLPLRADLNTDVDGFSGEFLEIAKTTPPAVDLIDIRPDASNDAEAPIGDSTGAGPDDQPNAFETNEEIAASSTLTECDIVNTEGWYVGPGASVKIVNVTNGNSELVTLSQEINPLDTIMYFYSHTFEHSYPDASPIVIDSVTPPPPNARFVFMYNNLYFTGTEFYVAQLDWDYFANMPRETFARKVKLKRNGVEMLILYPGDEPPSSTVYYRIDRNDQKFTFDGTSCLPFVDEWLQVDIDLTR